MWPPTAFKMYFNRDAKPHEITKITQAGESYTGVFRPESDGKKDGCIELMETGFCEMQHSGDLLRSDEADSQKDFEAGVKFALKRARVTTKDIAGDNEEDVTISIQGEKNRGGVDDLDDLWGGIV